MPRRHRGAPVHRRRRGRAGISPRRGPDGQAVRAGWPAWRRADVRHRRSRTPGRTGNPVRPGAQRPAGQAARISHRAGRDRGVPGRPGRAGAGGVRGAGRRARRLLHAADRRGGAGGPRAARALRDRPARPHDPVALPAARGAASHAEREAGPRGPARAGRAARGRCRRQPSTQRGGGGAAGDLALGAAGALGDDSRQLLRARRHLDLGVLRGDANRDPAGGRGPGAQHLRAPDHRRPRAVPARQPRLRDRDPRGARARAAEAAGGDVPHGVRRRHRRHRRAISRARRTSTSCGRTSPRAARR